MATTLVEAGGAARRRSRPAENARPGSERQQSYLLGVVYDLISEHGIDALTMRQVAAAGGVSTGTINYHFGNKENLVISALEAAYQLPGDWEAYRGSPAAQLRRLALSYALKSSSNRWWRFWINYLAASTRNEEMQAHQEVRFDKQLMFWSALVAEGIRLGEFQTDLVPDEVARELLVLVHGLLAVQFMKPDSRTRTYAKGRVLLAIDRLRKVSSETP
jgi:AcrR family transcriptional regulator